MNSFKFKCVLIGLFSAMAITPIQAESSGWSSEVFCQIAQQTDNWCVPLSSTGQDSDVWMDTFANIVEIALVDVVKALPDETGDTGTGSDTGSGTDTGSGDTGAGSDTGSGTDTGSDNTGAGSDTGSGTDTGSGNTGAGSDTGSGADTGSDNTGASDTGSGTDTGSDNTGASDTGSGTDTGSGDTGAGSDTGSGTDTGTDIGSDSTGADSGTGTSTDSGSDTGSTGSGTGTSNGNDTGNTTNTGGSSGTGNSTGTGDTKNHTGIDDGNNTDRDSNDNHVINTPDLVSRLINISARCKIEAAPNNAVVGFIIDGTGKKRLLLRAIRSAIEANSQFDVHLTLYRITPQIGIKITENDNWRTGLQAADIMTLPIHLQPAHDTDAALLTDLEPGVYTVEVTANHAGITTVSVDDLDTDAGLSAQLINMSGRCKAGVHDMDSAVIGFVIQGQTALNTLLRGIRSEIENNVLDPYMRLYQFVNHQPQPLDENDSWAEYPQTPIASRRLQSNLVPDKHTDAAILRSLNVGIYTLNLYANDIAGIATTSIDLTP